MQNRAKTAVTTAKKPIGPMRRSSGFKRGNTSFLLKGLSFDEIATVRDTKEKTVRQQATAIYRKSGLNGRHEFAAWFFEDFLG